MDYDAMVAPPVDQLRLFPVQPAAVHPVLSRIQQGLPVEERKVKGALFQCRQRHRLQGVPVHILQGRPPVPFHRHLKGNTPVIQNYQPLDRAAFGTVFRQNIPLL